MVEHGALGGFVALEADETDARVGNELQDGIEHAEAGAQNGHEHDFAFELVALRFGERGLHGDGAQAKRARGFVQHERGHFAQAAAEFLRTRALVAQAGEVVLHQGMGDNSYAFHAIRLTRLTGFAQSITAILSWPSLLVTVAADAFCHGFTT